MARKITGPTTSSRRNQRWLIEGTLLQACDHDKEPHRGQNRAALKGAARFFRADPAHIDCHHDSHRRQKLGKKSQRAAWLCIDTQPRYSAPYAIRRQRPDAEQGEYQDHFLEQRIERTVNEQNAGDRIAEAALRQVLHHHRVRVWE